MATISVLNTSANLSGKTLLAAENDYTITGNMTYDRDPSAPFTVTASSAKVSNLDADKLDGVEGAAMGQLGVAATWTASQTFNDSVKLILGTGADAEIYYDGTDLLVKPNVVGSGGILTADSAKFLFGTGKDAELYYDGTDLILNTQAVGTGALSLTKGQIKFPGTQNASTDVNTLDDYEEGTWTPVIGGGGGTSGQTYTTQTGHYVKAGKLVTAAFNATLSAKGTITGAVQIQGFPFTAEAFGGMGAIPYYVSIAVGYNSLGAVFLGSGTAAAVYGTLALATTVTALTTTDIGNATQLAGTITYKATA